MVATHSVVALGLGMLTGSAVAWHNPWDVRPKAYHTTNQCEVPRGASAKTKFYSYDLNPEWGTLDFLGPAVRLKLALQLPRPRPPAPVPAPAPTGCRPPSRVAT